MSRPFHDQGYAGGIPEYRSSNDSPRQRQNVHPQSRIPRPGVSIPDRMRGPPAMRPEFAGAPPGRSPRRGPAPQQQPYYPPSNPTWQNSDDLYDGSAYDYEEDYGQNDQWPLPAPTPARPMGDNSNSPRRVPQRPHRPDDPPQRLDYQQYIRDPPRSLPPMAPASRQHYQNAPVSHHGNGQWTGDGYSYTPPPNYPLPDRPLQPIAANASEGLSAIPPYQIPQQVIYTQQENRRPPPLGPPPSARRGPSSYYPQVGPVHPIVEETDSMRGSTRTGSVHTGGHDSKNSFASSNAIPIGISQTNLDRGREAAHQPVQRPAPLSDTEDEGYDDSPTEPAIARGDIRTPEPAHLRAPPSPEQGIVRQASLGKRSKPTLTTVRSSDQIRKISGDSKSRLASLPSPKRSTVQNAPSTTGNPETIERSRALAQEMLEGQAQAGAPQVQQPVSVRSDEHQSSTAPAVAAATTYMQESRLKQETAKETIRSGTVPIDPSSDCEDNSNNHIRQRSKELLGAELSNQLHPRRSTPRSPLAPAVDLRVESIIGSLEKGGALSAEEAQELKQPMGGLSERAGRRRPPRLDVDAVKEAEARGSLTSLPDLIRRATKLASNLDRGKTASRMGMNWFEGAEAEERKRRSGSMSDILAAFPPPALATPPESRNAFRRSLATWSTRNRHSALPSDSDAGAFKRRRCCGMPRWLFVCLLVLLVLLAVAAIILPVVLVVIPNQENAGTTKVGSCAAKLTCENGGTNIMSSSGNCKCVCVNGYTGFTCSTRQQSGCTSISVGISSNATIGEAIPRLLSSAASNFSIPLDSEELLGLFSDADINCNVQNQLVTFNGQASKRGLEGQFEVRHVTPDIVARQVTSGEPTETINDILHATGTRSAISASTSATPTAMRPTSLDFARVVVLYVLQVSQALQVAADAQETFEAYFRSGETTTGQPTTASNVTLGGGFSVDMTRFRLSIGNGTTIGGQ